MFLSEPFASLIKNFQDEFDKNFYLNSQRMSDSVYHITESSELNLKRWVQNMLIWPCFGIFA